jgi:hypothetical protein
MKYLRKPLVRRELRHIMQARRAERKLRRYNDMPYTDPELMGGAPGKLTNRQGAEIARLRDRHVG